ncbi:hypothetical protein PT2222_230090 [Paraburkholderia tropica]
MRADKRDRTAVAKSTIPDTNFPRRSAFEGQTVMPAGSGSGAPASVFFRALTAPIAA